MTSRKGILAWVLALGLGIGGPAFAQIQCTGWVGAKPDGSGAVPFSLRTDIDNSEQTEISGSADGVYALLIYFKDEDAAEISVTDTRTRAAAGTHGGFNRAGLLSTGFSLGGSDNQPARHVDFECRKSAR